MDKSVGQADEARAVPTRGPGSRATRERLLAGAAELIAERGWGRVTTRGVADRAGLPHGSVSYHFRGKQELLIEACMLAFSEAVPLEDFAALSSVDELLALTAAEVGEVPAANPGLSRLMFEAMGEAERDEALRARMRTMLAEYRQVVVGVVEADQQRHAVRPEVSAQGVATLLAAVGDGLLLHALLDPDLDVADALETLRCLVARP